MARLDAAAHFIPTLTFNLTALTAAFAVNREQATAAFNESSVTDQDAAVVRARSEFSIISDKPVSLVLFRSSSHDTPAKFLPNLITLVWGKGSFSRRIQHPNCVRLSPEKQAIARVFCRIRENEDRLLLDLA